jgi:anti-sigma factor RsiW
MTAASCKRSWEAEAVRDGRLVGAERVSFEGHAQRCPACSHERQQLAELAEQLRAHGSPSDEVTLRRLRQSILQRADAELREPRRQWRRVGLYAAPALVALALAFTFARWSGSHIAPAAIAQVTAQGAGARWTRSRSAGVEAVQLGEGVFSVVVRRAPGDPRVQVYVPEGHIEDLGTTFEVSVHGGRTTQIAVSEGSVMFHRRGREPLRLGAGTTWRPEPVQPARALPPSAASGPEPRERPIPGSVAEHKSVHAHQRAATHHEHPVQPMLDEDAAYLRVLALLREGRKDEARLAAADYLTRFPTAFRRPEIERIAAH